MVAPEVVLAALWTAVFVAKVALIIYMVRGLPALRRQVHEAERRAGRRP
jgi:hypothetical protein